MGLLELFFSEMMAEVYSSGKWKSPTWTSLVKWRPTRFIYKAKGLIHPIQQQTFGLLLYLKSGSSRRSSSHSTSSFSLLLACVYYCRSGRWSWSSWITTIRRASGLPSTSRTASCASSPDPADISPWGCQQVNSWRIWPGSWSELHQLKMI